MVFSNMNNFQIDLFVHIDERLKGTTTSGQSESKSNDKEEILYTPHISRNKVSLSDVL